MALCSRSFEDLFKTIPLLYKLDKLCDVIVVCGNGVEFKTHKLFLSKASGYFYALFKGNFGESNDIVNIMFDSNTLEDILIFLYTGKIYLADENIAEIIKAADFLLIDTLLMKCRDYMLRKISLDCGITFLNLSHVVERLHIREHCFRFVQVYFGCLVHKCNSDIEQLPLDVFKDLISSNSLGVADEETVWKAIVIWIEMDLIRLKYVLELIHCIRWSDVNYWLTSCIAVHPIFKHNELCRSIQLEKLVRTIHGIHESENNAGRFPKKLHIFTCRYTPNPRSTSAIGIFLTYDDQQEDIWRKIAEIETERKDNFESVFAFGQFVFMFHKFSNTLKSFNLVTKSWHQITIPDIEEHGANSIVFCQNRIFVVGSSEFGSEVQYYDLDTDVWSYCADLPSMFLFEATSLSDRLYVIGYREELPGFKAMTYDAAQNVWFNIKKPKKFSTEFSLINFRDHLYILGGCDEEENVTRRVEVYCPERNEWNAFPDLPFSYEIPQAAVLREKLIIYDAFSGIMSEPRFPSCTWNEKTEAWDVSDASSLYNKLYLYGFCHIDDTHTLEELTKENRDPKTVWENTPFESH